MAHHLALYPGSFDPITFGHLDVIGSKRTVSTRGHRPDQRLLVFLSAAQLLWDLTVLIQTKERSRKFVGADSTFTLMFTWQKKAIVTSNQGAEVDQSSPASLARAALDGARDLLATYGQTLEEDPKPATELENAIFKFSTLVDSLG